MPHTNDPLSTAALHTLVQLRNKADRARTHTPPDRTAQQRALRGIMDGAQELLNRWPVDGRPTTMTRAGNFHALARMTAGTNLRAARELRALAGSGPSLEADLLRSRADYHRAVARVMLRHMRHLRAYMATSAAALAEQGLDHPGVDPDAVDVHSRSVPTPAQLLAELDHALTDAPMDLSTLTMEQLLDLQARLNAGKGGSQ